MAVESNHVNATLRLIDTERSTVQTMSRIRPNIGGPQVEDVAGAVELVRGQVLGNAILTIVSELTVAAD